MSVTLTNNFLLNARGFNFADGGGLTWSFNKNTNTISVTGGGSGFASVSSGWGSPLNGTVISNYNATTATAAQTNQVVAQLIAALKLAGVLSA